LLIALRMKGETAREIACAAQGCAKYDSWDAGPDGSSNTANGGDGLATSTLGTATAWCAGAGSGRQAWHRSVSSRTGSADRLTALGAEDDGDTKFPHAATGELRVLASPAVSSGLEKRRCCPGALRRPDDLQLPRAVATPGAETAAAGCRTARLLI